MLHAAIGDPIGGLNGAAALLLGFMQQRNTGEGQHIDLSQVECMLPMVAPSILEQSATGATSPASATAIRNTCPTDASRPSASISG
jgi:crotonobetainyl-CoA:carnitine CoA-transferase CaiB-like acyl-CoA transferase